MKSKLLSDSEGTRLFAVVLDPGEEAFSAIEAFAADERIIGASITAIGAFERATIGWFDFDRKDYRRISIDEQCEVLSLLGDVGRDEDGKVSLHLHAVLGLSDGSTRGGPLPGGKGPADIGSRDYGNSVISLPEETTRSRDFAPRSLRDVKRLHTVGESADAFPTSQFTRQTERYRAPCRVPPFGQPTA
jgi:predicted DNA-binding protein with PD1-like motif